MMEHSPEEAIEIVRWACADMDQAAGNSEASEALTSLTDELQRLRGERDAYREAAQDANSDAARWMDENTEHRVGFGVVLVPATRLVEWQRIARQALASHTGDPDAWEHVPSSEREFNPGASHTGDASG